MRFFVIFWKKKLFGKKDIKYLAAGQFFVICWKKKLFSFFEKKTLKKLFNLLEKKATIGSHFARIQSHLNVLIFLHLKVN